MKKKIIALALSIFITVSVFAVGFSTVPSSGKWIVVMKGSEVVWRATNWTMKIETAQYTKVLGLGGDDVFKYYEFTGTCDKEHSLIKRDHYKVIDCDDLTWFWE